MIPYLFLFVFATILYFQDTGRRVGVLFYIFIAFLILLSGFRDMIGGYDVYIYADVYESPLNLLNCKSSAKSGLI